MKYWVYKDSRILGPFEKDAFAGLPGVDSSTLVCAGDSAAAFEADWRPVGDVADLAALPVDRGPAWSMGDPPSTYGLLDKLQIDAAGLIGDDDFPGASEDLFQDATMKGAFADLLTPRPSAGEAELRRAKDRAAELTVQLEMLYRRVSELEAGQTSLMHRLAEKEMLLRTQSAAPANLRDAGAAPSPAPTQIPPPAPAPVPAPSAFVPAVPAAPPVPSPEPEPPSDWPTAAPAGVFPSLPPQAPEPAAPPSPPPQVPIAATAPRPAAHEPPPPLPADSLPPAPAFSPPASPKPATPPSPAVPVELTAPAVPPAPAQPKKTGFERKTFKIVPTVKAFRVVGTGEGYPASSGKPVIPAASSSAAAPAGAAFDWTGSAPPAEPAVPAAKVSTRPTEPASVPAPQSAPPAPMSESQTMRAPLPTPAPAPPVTLSFGNSTMPVAPPIPGFATPEFGFANPQSPTAPPVGAGTGAGGGDMTGAPSTQEALARLAKPAAPATAAPRPRRSNKSFLIGGGALLVVMVVVVALFLRHPKDLKQMTDLDDGRARVGAEPVDDQSRLPLIKPKMPAPPTDVTASPSPVAVAPATEAPQAASQAKLDAAIAAVKDFPLDGDRSSVAELLQFSYAAVPDAGKESWSASETADKTYLVEYRFTPSAPGATDKHYLFEVDMERGFVIGKNLDAQNMLSGGPRVESAKSKPKAKPKKTAKRAKAAPHRAESEDLPPKEVPLLPLPNEGDLRPPAEDDGAFNSDTVNSGL